MAKGALDSTHTVVVKSENRGIRVVIGALALILWARWWWTGSLFAAVAYAMPPADVDGQGFESITGTLLPIAVDLLWFIGSVVISCTAWFWAAVWDVISGLIETVRYYSARRAAIEAAQKAATEAGTDAAGTNAGAIASTGAVDAAENQATDAAAPAEASPPKPRLNVEKLKALLNSHEDKLAAADEAFSKLNGRLQFTEDLTQSLNGWTQEANERLSKLEETALRQGDLSALAEYVGRVVIRVEALEASKVEPAADLPEEHPVSVVAAAKPLKPAYRRATRQTPAKAKAKR